MWVGMNTDHVSIPQETVVGHRLAIDFHLGGMMPEFRVDRIGKIEWKTALIKPKESPLSRKHIQGVGGCI